MVLALAPSLRAQGSAQLTRGNPVPDLFAALVNLTLSEELSTTNLQVHDDRPGVDDTRVRTLRAPWSRDFDVGSRHGELHVGAAIGALLASEGLVVPSAFGPARIDQDWTVLCAQVELGWTRPLGAGWNVRPGIALAIAYLENDAEYNAAGEAVLAPLLDGVLANWDAWGSLGALTLTVEHPRDPERFSYGVVARYAAVSSDVFAATDEFQEHSDTSQFAAVRAELGGLTPLTAWGAPIRWDAFTSWTGLFAIDEQTLGFDHLIEFGGGLSLRPMPKLPGLRFGASILDGADVTGWSAGLSFAF